MRHHERLRKTMEGRTEDYTWSMLTPMPSQYKSLLQLEFPWFPRVSRLALKAATRVRKATRWRQLWTYCIFFSAVFICFPFLVSFLVGRFLSRNSGNARLHGLAERSGAFPGGSQGSRDTKLACTARVPCFH